MMQRNTIVPMLTLILMFGMFVYYDLKISTQYSVVDSVLPGIFLGIITLTIIMLRSQNRNVVEFFGSLILAPLSWIMLISDVIFGSPNTGSISTGGVGTPPDSTPEQNSDNSALKENLHRRISKMLDENGKYDEFTVTTILKELENIKE